MEKRRRARINHSLSVLKSIILQEANQVILTLLFQLNSFYTATSECRSSSLENNDLILDSYWIILIQAHVDVLALFSRFEIIKSTKI